MGNWRTVSMTGKMTARDAAMLRTLLDRDTPGRLDRHGHWDGWEQPYACLSYSSARPSLAGIGDWPAATVSRAGNLAERNYDVDDIAGALRSLLAAAPSMLLLVHCGAGYESLRCAATIAVGEGLVRVGPPAVAAVDAPPAGQADARLLHYLLRAS